MRHTNNARRLVLAFLVGVASLSLVSSGYCAEEEVRLHKRATVDEVRCLRELFRARRPFDRPSAREIDKFTIETAFARADLNGDGQSEFIFLVHDIGYCGSAGCLMLIGERHRDGRCHLLDDGKGAADIITILNRRDHGYRRLYTPCEIYFDGRQYQQVREECPTIDVQR